MEGNENPNTVRRERAVRPVNRNATGGSSVQTGSRNSVYTGNRRNPQSGSSGRSSERTYERRNTTSGGREVSSGRRTASGQRTSQRTSSDSRERTEERRNSGSVRRSNSGRSTAERQRRTENRERQRQTSVRNRKASPDLTKLAVNPKVIGGAAGLLLIIILVIIGVRSFGAGHKSSVNVVKELLQASVDGDIKGMKDAYGINGDIMVDVQEAFDATIAYYAAHNVKKLEFGSSGTLFDEGDYFYIYMLYNLELENDQKYPCIGTYITQNVDGKYYVLTPAKVTEDLSQKATEAYKKFMTTDTYKNYTREYDTFIKKNPGYEEKIAAKLA